MLERKYSVFQSLHSSNSTVMAKDFLFNHFNHENCDESGVLFNEQRKRDFLYDSLFEERDAGDNEKEFIAENPGKYVMFIRFIVIAINLSKI